jgi:hypothetical protein
MPVAGVLRLESARLTKDNLIFEYLWPNQSEKEASMLYLSRDPLALRASAKVARNSESLFFNGICPYSSR